MHLFEDRHSMTPETSANELDGWGTDRGAPTVSVIIPAFRAEFIDEAIVSVRRQSFSDYEILVVNDGSPDTDALENTLAVHREHVRYFKQPNRGPAAARNTGLRAARGEYVAFLDADDYWSPTYLAAQISFLQQNPRAGAVCSDARLIGDPLLADRTFLERTSYTREITFESLLSGQAAIVLSGVVVRRVGILDVGLFDERFRYSEDYDLWLRLLRDGTRFMYNEKELVFRREHQTNLTCDRIDLFRSALSVLGKVKQSFPLDRAEHQALARHSRKLTASMNLELGKISFSRGQFAEAAGAIRNANRYYRSWKLRAVLLWLRIWPTSLLRIYRRRGVQALASD